MNKMCLNILFFISLMAMVPLWASPGHGDDEPERQTIALRSIGHKLLLKSGDSTSRVLPVHTIGNNSYRIDFEKPFTPDANALFDIVSSEMETAGFPPDYVVSILDCKANEVQYTYGMPLRKGQSPPCITRLMPEGRYYITIHFTKRNTALWYSAGVIPLFLLCGWQFYRKKKKPETARPSETSHCLPIGTCSFYPQKRRLVVNGTTISLTAKEAKVLRIFAENINDEVSRERLQKEVWEDEGVIVGRSLDMFVSKLRKKFEGEPSIQIINIHGKGYKLVVDTA